MDSNCIFCKIAAGVIPSRPVFRDDGVLAIEDRNPQAPSHVLVMPVHHHANIGDLVAANDPALVARLVEVASKIGRERGGNAGYRLVINTGDEGGQTVDHLHVHVLSGRHMTWPPG